MRFHAVAVALIVLASGCLGGGPAGDPSSDDGQEAPPPADGERRVVTRSLVFEANVSAGTGDARTAINETATLGTGLESLELSLVWNQGTNRFSAHALAPSGDEHVVQRDVTGCCASNATGSVDQAGPGLWQFYVMVEGQHVPDHVRLFVNATWRLPADQVPDDASPGPIRTHRSHGGWQAWTVVRENGTVSDTVDVAAGTTNGAVNLTAGSPEVSRTQGARLSGAPQDGQTASVRVYLWARADTEDQARQRVRSLDVSIEIDRDSVDAQVQGTSWRGRGANVDVVLPSDTSTNLTLDTTNGPLAVEAAQVLSASLDTTNGPIEAGLRGQGPIELDTTNGPIELQLAPTGTAELSLDTSNGAAVLGLSEADEIGYELDAGTSNGQVTESMEEAELRGGDQEATLVTEGFEDRPVQVTGVVDTTNGNVDFRGR